MIHQPNYVGVWFSISQLRSMWRVSVLIQPLRICGDSLYLCDHVFTNLTAQLFWSGYFLEEMSTRIMNLNLRNFSEKCHDLFFPFPFFASLTLSFFLSLSPSLCHTVSTFLIFTETNVLDNHSLFPTVLWCAFWSTVTHGSQTAILSFFILENGTHQAGTHRLCMDILYG